MALPLEIWFDFGSNYSYLAVMRVEEMAARQGIGIAWKPFLLGPVFKALGRPGSPFLEQKEKGAYVWRDMERLCARYGLPAWKMPSEFPRMGVLASRVVLAGEDQPWVGAFCRRVMDRNFAQDQDINVPASLHPILTGLEVDADALLAAAQSDEVKAKLRAQTDRALSLGIFGAPTFFAGPEMFWGNDRLEEALEWAAET